MRYHFERKNGQIADGYTILNIIDHVAEVDNADTEAILLAEKHGGELLTKQGKPPKNPAKYKADQIEHAAQETATANESDLTKQVESGELATEDAPRLTDPVAEQQQKEK